jgi:hypothetical protein
VCQSCGGWTPDGGYMSYRKFINEQTGQPELRCVKVMDDAQAQGPQEPAPIPMPQSQASYYPSR